MTNQEFREWLKGFFELSGDDVCLEMKQLQVIINHLNLAEAVDGRLDAVNQRLRSDIQDFRNRNPADLGEFEVLTADIRMRLFSA